MKARPVKTTKEGDVECQADEATHVWLCMPGPLTYRRIPVVHGAVDRRGTNCWSWNGDTEKPTLKPSILTKGGGGVVCHSFVNNGVVRFLSDCSHEFANQEVDLLDVEDFNF